jgi:predicted amidohydrolase
LTTGKTVRIVLGQLDVEIGRPEINLARVEDVVSQIPAADPEDAGFTEPTLLILPELWSTGYDLAEAAHWAAWNRQHVMPRLAQLARDHRLYVAGSLLWESGERVCNTLLLHGPDGRLLESYSKIHLFRLMDEERYLAAGDRIVVAPEAGGLRAGLSVCYDLRFPEVFRRLATQGANLIVVVAEWPAVRVEHWLTLLKARAIENQIFVAGVNRVGVSGDTRFGGHSAVFDPFGRCLTELDADAGVSMVKVDLDEVGAARASFPAWDDRRPEVY